MFKRLLFFAAFIVGVALLWPSKPNQPPKRPPPLSTTQPVSTPVPTPEPRPTGPPLFDPPLARRNLAPNSAGLVDHTVEREEYRYHVRELLRERRYEELEREATLLREERSRFTAGLTKHWEFYHGVGLDHSEGQPINVRHAQERIAEWLTVVPDSLAARIARTRVLMAIAWFSRGWNTADKVTGPMWERFFQRLDEAAESLADAEKYPPLGAGFYTVKIDLAGYRQRPLEEIFEALEQGLAVDPGDPILYRSAAQFLMPGWSGDPAARAEFVQRARERNPGALGEELCAHLAPLLLPDPESSRVEWRQIRGAMRVLLSRYPASRRNAHAFALLAWRYDDREAAREAFGHLDRWCTQDCRLAWRSRERMEAARAWADGAPFEVREAPGRGQPGEHLCHLGSGQMCLQYGSAVLDSDPVEAAAIFTRACYRESGKGCLALAALHDEGRGIAADPGKAAELRERACALEESLCEAPLAVPEADGLRAVAAAGAHDAGQR